MVDSQWLELLIECVVTDFVLVLFAISVVFPFPLSREMGFDPGVFGRFDLAALVQPHLKLVFVCLCYVCVCVNLTLANPSARVRCHSSPQGWQSH